MSGTFVKRDRTLKFRATPEEEAVINRRMKECGVHNRAAFLRRMAMCGYLINLDLPELSEVSRMLSINSNNLNQVARRANAIGMIDNSDIKELIRQQGEILKTLREIYDQLQRIDQP